MARTLTVYLAADTDKFKHGMTTAGDSAHGLKGKLGGLSDFLGANLGPAMATAGLAVGGLAVKLGVDGVQAAIDDRLEVEKLTTVMDNLGLSQDVQPTLDQIDALQRLTGVSESVLRPEFSKLLTSTGDTKGAFDLLTSAIDISIGSGNDLSGKVIPALVKAYDGNMMGLSRMFPFLDKEKLKTDGIAYAIEELSKKYSGSAAAAADTYAGKIDLLQLGFGELQESFGQGFLDGLGAAEGGLDKVTTFMADNEDTVKDFGDTVGSTAKAIADLAGYALDARENVVGFVGQLDKYDKGFASGFVDMILSMNGTLSILNDSIDRAIYLYHKLNEIAAAGTYTGPAGNGGGGLNTLVQPDTPPHLRSLDPIGVSKSITTVQTKAAMRTGN